jgi:CxxC-x17-CxxC domain-containing protein
VIDNNGPDLTLPASLIGLALSCTSKETSIMLDRLANMIGKDKQLKCCECKLSFVFCAEEQIFFESKGLMNAPKRCANCRVLMRSRRSGIPLTETAENVCKDCGVLTRVPFQPSKGRVIYCNKCLRPKNSKAKAPGELPL